MSAEDIYTFAARERLQRLEADRARALAELQEAKASNDTYAMGDAVEAIAALDVRKECILGLHDRYVRSQTPVQPPELTQEEKAAKPIHAMDYSDVYEMSQKSRYGVDENAFRAGMAEVLRRRARGE
jgi:hypothetical protein